MAKHLKNPAADTAGAADLSPERTTSWRARESLLAAAGAAVFVVLCGLYAVYFFRVPIARQLDLYRYQLLGFFLVPEELVQQWRAAPVGDVAVADRIPLLLLAGTVWGVAFLLGWLVLSRVRIARQLSRLEYFAFATGIGLSGLSLLTLAVGLLGGLNQPLVFLAAGLAIVMVSVWQARRVAAWRADRPASASASAAAGAVGDEPAAPARQRPRAWWCALPFVLVIVGGALLPPLDFDVLEYHLQVPREWVQSGRITFLPHNVYGNMPLGAEALAALTMAVSPGEEGWWWGALAGKLVMALFAPLTALLLYSAASRCVSREAGIVAALLYLSTPWITHVSANGLNEGVIGFYLLAASYTTKRWLDERHADPVAARGYVWLAGWMAGAAAACKYTCVVLVVLPLLIVVLVMSRRDWLRTVSAFVVAVMLACGLWYGKNWVQTGNPVYPLLPRVFTSQPRTPEQVVQFQRAHRVPVDAEGRRYSPAQAWATLRSLLGDSVHHSPLLVPFAALVLVRRRTLRQAAYWLIGGLVFVAVWWLTTHRLDRFLVPACPLFALVGAIGATWSSSRVWRGTMWTVLGLGLAASFMMVVSRPVADNRYLVRLTQLRDDPQLTTVTVAHRYLNQHVPPRRRALVVGDAAVFNLRVPVLYSTCFDTSVLEELLRDRDAQARRARLKELRVSHIFVNWQEIARYQQPGNYGFTAAITPELIHGELEAEQRLIRAVAVPELDRQSGEIFEVVTSPDRP